MSITHVRTNIREAVKAGLLKITSAHGYNHTILRVYDPPCSFEQMADLPAVNIALGEEKCDNADDVTLEGNRGILHNGFILNLECVMNASDDPQTQQDNMLADILRYFGTFYNIPDVNGNPTALSAVYQGSNPFGVTVNKPMCGIDIQILVKYRQLLTDPGQLC